MKDIRIVRRDRLRPRLSLERRNLVPEVVQHGIRRRMAIVAPPVHLTASDHVYTGDLLLNDRGLSRAKLSVREVALTELPCRDKPVQRLVPARHAVSAN